MRSRPKGKIEPIHIQELLQGAGMRGFLSVLDPPVPAPHLRELGRGGDAAPAGMHGAEPLSRLSALAEALLGKLGRQDHALRTISEMAYRINGGALALQRRAEAARKRHIARSGLQESRERVDEKNNCRGDCSHPPQLCRGIELAGMDLQPSCGDDTGKFLAVSSNKR